MDSPSTHISLLEGLRGDEAPAAWQVFESRYGPLIRDYGRRSGLQASDCDDLLQDVLLSLTRAMPAFRYDPSRGSLRAYLKTVSLRAVSKKRSQKHEHFSLEQVLEPNQEEHDPWEAAWRAHHVRRAMQRLASEFPAPTVAAFRHYVLEERKPEETAALLGISMDSVYQAKSRLMKRISDLIAQQVEEEG